MNSTCLHDYIEAIGKYYHGKWMLIGCPPYIPHCDLNVYIKQRCLLCGEEHNTYIFKKAYLPKENEEYNRKLEDFKRRGFKYNPEYDR